MVEWLQVGPAVFRQAGEYLHLLLGVAELGVALTQQPDAALVAGQRVFEAGRAVFEFAKDGFEFGNSPLAYVDQDLRGKTIVMTTTNGTKAINLVDGQRKLVIGAFLNLTALSEWLVQQNENILLLCSGWKDKFNLEDSVFAGAVMERLLEEVSFTASEQSGKTIRIDAQMVQDKVAPLAKNTDLSKFIL